MNAVTGRRCHACGHQHRTMASVWSREAGTRWYCHENDHSCYALRGRTTTIPF